MNDNAGSHYHSVGAHSHGLNSHTHSGPSHSHTIFWYSFQVQSGGGAWPHCVSGVDWNNNQTSTHTSGTGNTGGASGSTANSSAFNSGAASGNTANAGSGGGHNHGFTGTGATISTMPPYLSVYMWKRTA